MKSSDAHFSLSSKAYHLMEPRALPWLEPVKYLPLVHFGLYNGPHTVDIPANNRLKWGNMRLGLEQGNGLFNSVQGLLVALSVGMHPRSIIQGTHQ